MSYDEIMNSSSRVNEILLKINEEVNLAGDFDTGLIILLQHVANFFHFDLCLTWIPSDDRHFLKLGKAHYSTSDEGKTYWQQSRDVTFKTGEGMVGRVGKSGKAEFIEDVEESTEEIFRRRQLAHELKIRSVFCIPVVMKGHTELIISFYKTHKINEGAKFLRLINALVKPLTPLLVSQRTSAELKASNKQLQELSSKLRASEEKWQSLFKNAKQIIFLIDLHGNLVTVNHLSAKLRRMGYKVRDAIGSNYLGFFPEAEKTKVDSTLKYVMQNKKSQVIEVVGTSGAIYEISYIPWQRDHEVIGVIAILQDITHRKQLEIDNYAYTMSLKKQNRELEELAYVASHDLKVPASNLYSLLHLFKLEGFITQSNEELFGRICSSVKLMHTTIESLNEIIAFKQTLDAKEKEVNLEEVLTNVKLYMEDKIAKSGARIIHDFSACENIIYPAIHVQSIFQNLLTNAIKYKHVDREPEIKITSKYEDGFVCLTFTDNGCGIDLELNKDKLFGLFKRLHKNGEGKGIGLYIVKSIVESYGGFIDVDSEVGKGTTFKLFLYESQKEEAQGNTAG